MVRNLVALRDEGTGASNSETRLSYLNSASELVDRDALQMLMDMGFERRDVVQVGVFRHVEIISCILCVRFLLCQLSLSASYTYTLHVSRP